MIVGEPSNDHIFEVIDICDLAQAQGTNVGVKAALKKPPKHQWWRRDTMKRVGNAREIQAAATTTRALAK
jgi:hypothetical protein